MKKHFCYIQNQIVMSETISVRIRLDKLCNQERIRPYFKRWYIWYSWHIFLAAKKDFIGLKAEVDKLDINKLITIQLVWII